MGKYIIASISVVVVLWLGVIVLAAGVLRIPDFNQYSLDATVAVHGGQQISQQIYIEHPSFSSLGISVKNINLQNHKDLILTIYEDKSVIRTVAINGIYIPDGKFLRFDFAPITDSMNKTYTIEFSAPLAVKEDALELYLTKQSFAQAGVLQVSGLPYEEYKALSFVSFHKPLSISATVSQIMNDFITRFTQDLVFVGLFIGIIVVLLVIGFTKKTDRLFNKLN
jgi:hypothetical protein